MTSSVGSPGLSIGQLAERTGVATATLRSWESRYGFPRPTRSEGGQRRYRDRDVAAVLEVLRRKESGLSLEASVGLVTTRVPHSRSIYAAIRSRHPDTPSLVLAKPALLAFTRAVEDECCALAEQPLLFGAFQHERFLRQSYPRWAELARTARLAVVFAAMAEPAPQRRPGRPVQVALPDDAPLRREWVVICDDPELPVCLVATQRPGTDALPAGRRLFDVVWSLDAQVVRFAARIAAAIAAETTAGSVPELRDGRLGLDDDPPPASPGQRRSAELMNRVIRYLTDQPARDPHDPGSR